MTTTRSDDPAAEAARTVPSLPALSPRLGSRHRPHASWFAGQAHGSRFFIDVMVLLTHSLMDEAAAGPS
jgi:hypothetical protein